MRRSIPDRLLKIVDDISEHAWTAVRRMVGGKRVRFDFVSAWTTCGPFLVVIALK